MIETKEENFEKMVEKMIQDFDKLMFFQKEVIDDSLSTNYGEINFYGLDRVEKKAHTNKEKNSKNLISLASFHERKDEIEEKILPDRKNSGEFRRLMKLEADEEKNNSLFIFAEESENIPSFFNLNCNNDFTNFKEKDSPKSFNFSMGEKLNESSVPRRKNMDFNTHNAKKRDIAKIDFNNNLYFNNIKSENLNDFQNFRNNYFLENLNMNTIKNETCDLFTKNNSMFSMNNYDLFKHNLINVNFNKEINQIDENIYSQINGSITSIIKIQIGSRNLQKMLKKSCPIILSKIFLEIQFEIPLLLVDSYANYFCQKLYTYLKIDEKLKFLLIIKNSLWQIAISPVGTYPMQTIVEQLTSYPEKEIIAQSVKNEKILQLLCESEHGSHVLEKIITFVPEELILFIYDFVIRNFMCLSCDRNGLSVVKK